MSPNPELRKLYEERHEWGKIERDAAELRQFSKPGGLWDRFWSWVEGNVREARLDVDADIRDITTAPVDGVDTGDGKP